MWQGDAIVHAGDLRHRAFPVDGRRHNLILWAMSSHTKVGVTPGAWETQLPPAAECVSTASDSDACRWDATACETAVPRLSSRDGSSYPEDLAPG